MSDPAAHEPSVVLEQLDGGRIWIIRLNRPEQRNALNSETLELLDQAFRDYRDDPRARVAIVTATGDRAFCAGADLRERDRSLNNGAPPPKVPELSVLSEGLNLWKPTIAAINGYAIAGGFMLAMQCDIRIMADHAKVGISETKWNQKTRGWTAPLGRQMTLGAALELALWGDTQYSAQRCYEVGWAQRVVPLAELMPTAMDYANRMVDLGPRSVRNIKEQIYRGYYLDPLEAKRVFNWQETNLDGMSDTAEGPRAFLEKRRPVFEDR